MKVTPDAFAHWSSAARAISCSAAVNGWKLNAAPG